MNRLRSCLACAIVLPSFIKIIFAGSLWYVIPLLHSWPREIRFKLHSGANATLNSSIVLPPESGMVTVPILLVRMIWPATVTKLMLLVWVFLKSLRLLHK